MFVIDSFSFFSFSVMRQLPLPYDHSFECYFEKPEAKASGFSCAYKTIFLFRCNFFVIQ